MNLANARTRRAFTLLELLTVIAIISVLVALVLPSLSGARQRGRITKCEANIREIAHATLRYVSQWDDVFPVSADCLNNKCFYWNGHQYLGWNGTAGSPTGRVWNRVLNNELNLEPQPPEGSMAKIAQCPSDRGAFGETGSSKSLFELFGTSYPLNPILCQGRVSDWKYRATDIGLSAVLQVSRKVVVADHPAFGLTYDGAWTGINPGWHDSLRPTAVVGFADGHAEYVQGIGGLREWQWYGEASGPEFVRRLATKVAWNVYPGAE
ncbi:MAG: type II secretion system protein [Planctomycetes bacterium]|nr:type II secretion system protein [Planctomycetota bacterium]